MGDVKKPAPLPGLPNRFKQAATEAAESFARNNPDACENDYTRAAAAFVTQSERGLKGLSLSDSAKLQGAAFAAFELEWALYGVDNPEGAGELSFSDALREHDTDLAQTFDRILSNIAQVRRAAWGRRLRERIESVYNSFYLLDPADRAMAQGALTAELTRKFGSASQAEKFLRTLEPKSTDGSFDEDGCLRALDFAKADLNNAWVVKGLIPAGQVGALFAEFSVGKTWVALHIALSVAFERQFFGRDVVQGPVIYCAAEGQRALWKRIAGWLVHRDLLRDGFTLDELQAVLHGKLIVVERPPQFDYPDLEALLRNNIEQTGARLIVFDTLGKSLGAEQSENSSDDAHSFTGMLSRITAATNCTALFLHHTGHGDKSRMRGASGLGGDVDFAFSIDGTAADFARGLPVTLRPAKMRDDIFPPPLAFKLRTLSLNVSGAPEPVGSAILEPAELARELPLPARLFTYIEQNPDCGAADCLRGSGRGDQTEKADALRDLKRIGAVTVVKDGKKHLHRVAPGWYVRRDGTVAQSGDDFPLDDLADPAARDEGGDV